MKEQLEQIWKDNKCRCPSHIIWWNNSVGYKEAENLFYRKGKIVNFLKRIWRVK